ncbi:MAG: DUF5696 domain-containing protein [Clostridia bacterium]|nr:DUF5696 domain-containing protein [Clostridia bacterium]
MKIKRITSLLLTVLMVFGSLQLAMVQTFAAVSEAEIVEDDFDHLKEVFYSAEDRLSKMELFVIVGDYAIYADDYSGEVAFKNVVTGEILLTNPYSVGSSKASTSQKYELLSQIIVKYTDNATQKTMTSYEEASMRGQVEVVRIKNGIRVEYSMGNEDPRILAPVQISKTRFRSEILSKIPSGKDKDWILSTYAIWDPASQKNEKLKEDMYKRYPITKEMAIYRLTTEGANKVTDADMRRIASIIKQYAPEYTFEDLDFDHRQTRYEGDSREPANFKMALEYVVENGDLVVTLPANGITYNEEEYTLDTLTILPYMGAGSNPNTGYTFLPDGSGAIFKFEDLNDGSTTTVTAAVYGTDYAFQTIKGSYEQSVRIPVFGIVENENVYKRVGEETEVEKEVTTTDENGESVTETVTETKTVYKKELVGNYDRGFVAIIEEGEAMCELSTYHGGAFHEYNTVKMTMTPRPKDSYNLATAISVGSNSTWTVVSERRYTGNYKIRYKLLTDTDLAAEKGVTDTYEPTWQGMANAYQDYLVENGVITKLTDEDLGDGIPLYIETFGAIESIKKILSIPVTVMTSMTSFDNIQTMYADLSAEGIKNINFKLTGYANGGMYATVPYKLKWEKAVGGKNGFKELLKDAKEKDYGIYPDFDFSYVNNTSAFDGISFKKHVVKTIDNRYSNLRVYSAARQNYATYYQLAISPAYYYRFVDKLAENYTDYDPIGISVGTLGYSLNTDFDKKEPYNREDGKNFTVDAFASLSETYDSVMTEGGNSYVWKDSDHIIDMPLDSSRYIKTSYTVPFIGYVLHGYKNFTGSAINMAGDIRYEILKCIENGAYMYFILSYENTDLLKEDELLSKYYSIRYDIWQDDVVELYNELNEILEPLQTKEIIGHEFLIGERILDEEEEVDTENPDKYTTMDDGRIVKVTYEDGTTFILNYNYFAVTVEGVNVDAYGYVKIN